MRRARPGIRSGFPLARYKGTPVNEVEAWSARGRFLFRQVARALLRLEAPAGKKALGDAVFQRMEGDHDEATACLQEKLGGAQAPRPLRNVRLHTHAAPPGGA